MTTFTREDYEMAAKAAGVDGWYEPGYLSFIKRGGGVWRPPEDDGDALRLAVKLGVVMCGDPYGDCGVSVEYGELRDGQAYEPSKPDPFAATRRAIFRAAIAIGRAMP